MILPDVDEKGPYCKDLLKGEDAAELRGFEWAVECVVSFFDNRLCELGIDGSLRAKFDAEIVEALKDDLSLWLYGDRAELVVSLIENGDYPDGEGEDQ